MKIRLTETETERFGERFDKLMQEAPLPVMPVPQVNVSLVKTVEALTGIVENMWNSDAGQPPEHLIHATQESRAISFGRRTGCWAGSRTLELGRGRNRAEWKTSERPTPQAADGDNPSTQSHGRAHASGSAAEENANI